MLRLIAMTAAVLAALFPWGPTKWDFEEVDVGGFPDHWKQMRASKENEPTWKVVEEKSAPDGNKALAYIPAAGESKEPAFCFLKDIDQDFFGIEVWLRSKPGKQHGGAGLVWHLNDAKNYRIADWNSSDQTLSVYAVENGKRRLLKSTKVAATKPAAGDWHRLRVDAWQQMNNFSCTLDGKEVLRVESKENDEQNGSENREDDDRPSPVSRLGIWADADADVLFDAFVLDGGERGFKRGRAVKQSIE